MCSRPLEGARKRITDRRWGAGTRGAVHEVMTARLVTVLLVSLLLVPLGASAQSNGENPSGFAIAMGTAVPLGLAAPVLLDDTHRPRPGSGTWRAGMGWQNAPDAVAAPASAGGYFGAASWLGLEGRFMGRVDGSTGVDYYLDVAELVLLRPTPDGSPFWIEAMVGGSFESGFGGSQAAYITGGPTGGVRLGARAALTPDISLVLEGEVLYNARFSPGYDGVRHQLEGALMLAVMFGDPTDDEPDVGVSLEYRREQALRDEPELRDTHSLTLGVVLGF